MSSRPNRTIYLGNLPGDIRKREIEDLFHKYGPIVDVELKIPASFPGLKTAVMPRMQYMVVMGMISMGAGCGLNSPMVDDGHRWIDIPVIMVAAVAVVLQGNVTIVDHMRRAGDVCFSEVYPERHRVTGIVDYTKYDDMKYAIKKLDDSLFKNAFSRAYIRVREYESWQSYSKSPSGSSYPRSHSPGSGRSTSKSPRGRRTRSASPVKSRSPSHSRSRSRSKSPMPRPSRRDRSPSNSPEKSSSRSLARSD